MEHFAGIDVSLEQSSVCVVDGAGKITHEAKVAIEPEALVESLSQSGEGSDPDRAGSRSSIAVAVCWLGSRRV